MITGCGIQRESDFTMWVGDGSATYVPTEFLGGNHELKFGYQVSLRDITGNAAITGSGNYHLMYDTVNGVPNQPVQLETTNAPVEPDNWDNVYSAYFADQWRLGQRLTFNLGLRVRLPALLCARADATGRTVCRRRDVPERRSRQVGPLRAARGRRVGRDRQRQDGRQGDVRQVQHRGGDLRELQPVHDLPDRVPLERSEPQRPLRSGRGQPRHQRGPTSSARRAPRTTRSTRT